MADERAIPGAQAWGAMGAHHLARYLFAGEFVRSKRVLDAGTGAGYGAALVRSLGAREVVGVDLDAAAIESARSRYAREGVQFFTDDCETLEKPVGPFDVMINFENIEHLRQPERFLKRAFELLAPAGVLLVSTPDRASTPPFVEAGGSKRPANPYHVNEWYDTEFAALLGKEFPQVELRVQVESHTLVARRTAVEALRQGISWSNPVMSFLWRKCGRQGAQRSWRVIEDLAAAGIADYPIVEKPIASVWGRAGWHVAICRKASS